MRSLIAMLALPACASTTAEVRFHATSHSFQPSPTRGPIDVFIEHAPGEPFQVVGLIVVSSRHDKREAAYVAAETARSIGCDLVTVRRDGEVTRLDRDLAPRRTRVLVASLGGGSFGGSNCDAWGSGGSRGSSCGSGSGYVPPDPIDPSMHKFWCGKYVLPRSGE